MGPTHRICSECKHIRNKHRANPFGGRLDALTPDILKARNKWEEKQNEIAELERQRFESGADFNYEPNFYPWCASWTKAEGRFTIDPVTGKKTPIFVLCAAGNANGDCPYYELRDEIPKRLTWAGKSSSKEKSNLAGS